MKNPYEVLKQKEADMERIQKEIDAPHLVTEMLAEEEDWVENASAPPGTLLRNVRTGTTS